MSFLPSARRDPLVLQPDEGTVLEVLGQLFTIKAAGQDTGGAYTVIEVASPPAGGPPLHRHHREDEAFYVLEGEYEIQYGDEKLKATAGSFIFAPREIQHTFRNISAGPSKVLVIVTPAGIENFFQELSDLTKQGPADIEKVKEIAARYEIELLLQTF